VAPQTVEHKKPLLNQKFVQWKLIQTPQVQAEKKQWTWRTKRMKRNVHRSASPHYLASRLRKRSKAIELPTCRTVAGAKIA